jgi:hypothetical protein
MSLQCLVLRKLNLGKRSSLRLRTISGSSMSYQPHQSRSLQSSIGSCIRESHCIERAIHKLLCEELHLLWKQLYYQIYHLHSPVSIRRSLRQNHKLP